MFQDVLNDELDVEQGSSVPSFSNKQVKKGFTTTTHCDDNDISFLISCFRKNPVEDDTPCRHASQTFRMAG